MKNFMLGVVSVTIGVSIAVLFATLPVIPFIIAIWTTSEIIIPLMKRNWMNFVATRKARRVSAPLRLGHGG